MRKHLIGTILVLAALTACNKEVETPAPAVDNGQEEVTSGKVTLTFKAAIDEATRTTYQNDQIAHWAADDAISVCVTNSGKTDYKIAKFKASVATDAGMEFTGEVESGYTTIVSGVYPANDVYSSSPNNYFKDGAVKSVYLPNSYDLEDADDTGRFIPLIGSYDGESMTFRHFCSAMKVTLTNVPADATAFTFTANGQQIAGDLALSDGRMGLDDGTSNTSVQFTFTSNPDQTERSFYIPVPDGTLAANSFVTVSNADEDLFKKRITSSPYFGLKNGKDAIRVLPAVACWTRKDNWNAYYYGYYKSSGVLYQRICLENMTGSYNYEVLTSSQFNNTYHGSAADYFSSTHFSDKISQLTTSFSTSSKNLNYNYNSLSKGKYYVMLFGLDQNLQFTGEYNCVEIVNPTFVTPEGWSINVVEDYKIAYTVPSGTQWQYVSVTKSDFESTYLGNLEYLIYKGILDRKGWHENTPTSWVPRTGNQTYTVSYNEEYVLLCIGIDDNYRPTGEFCRLDHVFEAPTQDYLDWVGTWTVSHGTKNDTWKITRRQANHSYNITGIAGQSYRVIGKYDNGALTLSSQLLEEKYGDNKRDLYLLARSTSGIYSTMDQQILTATMDDEGAVTVTPSTETAPGGYGIYYKITKFNILGTRDFNNPITMTKQ